MRDQFIQSVNEGYTFKGKTIILGAAMLEGEAQTGTLVKIPLETMNRHGLIAGATGTGKTKSLQILAEQLSQEGVPSLLMDMKGDLSGIAAESEGHPKIDERHVQIGIPFRSGASPVELLTLSDEPGVRLRATVSEFGPVLFSKILDLNETQSGIVSIVFKYCDDNKLPLVDLKDFRQTLQYLTYDGKEEVEKDYGKIYPASTGAILRRLITLEQQGAERFFGERSFDVEDLTRVDDNGRGIVSIVRLLDLQDRPHFFSTFMMSLLAEIYASFPEEGDLPKPKLVIFIDEAHLLFEKASDELMNQIEAIIKLIRSKGVGIYFVTQNPADIPDEVLGQLGLKIQHALRAFTAKDRKQIKLAAQNFPLTDYYNISESLTSLGIGEALVTALNEKGIPTPLVHTLLRAPESRMDILSSSEITQLVNNSSLVREYNEDLDKESAYEILVEKMEQAQKEEEQQKLKEQNEKARKQYSKRRSKEKSTIEKIADHTLTKQIGRTVARELTRGILGVLGIGRRRRRRSW